MCSWRSGVARPTSTRPAPSSRPGSSSWRVTEPSTWDGRRPADRSCATSSSRPARQPDPADLAADADEAQRVAEAMAELPEEQLAVLRLAYFDGLSHAEIAELIGIPLGTVKGRVRLALERLRSLSTRYDLETDQ